ncbi:MAG: hypothetical protein J3Q66DRAFT_364184 [Benniella sp.]|nr:MAG: hypothetical protein J3Q66DRAFT_364184 [Benniella sp.]
MTQVSVLLSIVQILAVHLNLARTPFHLIVDPGYLGHLHMLQHESRATQRVVATFGHTAALSNNTVFIQGGSTVDTLSKASYAIILDKDGSLNNATWLDTSKLSTFTPRNFGVAAATDNTMITCGTQDGAQGTDMTCDQFDVVSYKTSLQTMNITNRAGMAVAFQTSSKGTKAYFVGGYNTTNIAIGTVNVANIPTGISPVIRLEKGPDMIGILPRKFHTATWVDAPLNGMVMMGGRADAIITLPLTPVSIYDPIASNWTSVHLTSVGSAETTSYGHSAVSDGNGNIFVFGGIDGNGAVRSELLVLDTKQPKEKWSLQFLSKAPEGRALHTATLLPDKTMLIMWGQNGQGPNSAQSTYMLYDIKRNIWSTSKPQQFPAMTAAVESPNISKPVTNNPSDATGSNNTNKGPNGPDSGPSSEKSTLPLIIGISVVGGVLLILIVGLGLYFCCFKRRTLPVPHSGLTPEKDSTTLTSEQQEDKAKIKMNMSGMQRTIDPSYGDRHYVSNDASYNPPGAARNGLSGPGPRVPQLAAAPHGLQNVEGHLPPQYGVDLNAPQYDAGSRAPQHITEPHGPRHEFQYDMDSRAPQYTVDPVDHRMPQFGAHSGALLYAAESRAPQRVDLDRLNVDGNGHEHFPDVRYKIQQYVGQVAMGGR